MSFRETDEGGEDIATPVPPSWQSDDLNPVARHVCRLRAIKHLDAGLRMLEELHSCTTDADDLGLIEDWSKPIALTLAALVIHEETRR